MPYYVRLRNDQYSYLHFEIVTSDNVADAQTVAEAKYPGEVVEYAAPVLFLLPA